MSLKEELIAAFKAAAAEPPKPVTIQGFPTFYVRPVTIGEVDEQNANKDEWVKGHQLTAGAAIVICDESGALLFDQNDPADMEIMKTVIFKQSWPRMQKVLDALNKDDGIVAGN